MLETVEFVKLLLLLTISISVQTADTPAGPVIMYDRINLVSAAAETDDLQDHHHILVCKSPSLPPSFSFGFTASTNNSPSSKRKFTGMIAIIYSVCIFILKISLGTTNQQKLTILVSLSGRVADREQVNY